MMKLSDIKVGKKLALLSGVILFLLAGAAGLAVWALNNASAAAVQTDLADQGRERPVELPTRDPPTARADEERRRRGLGETSVAQPGVVV